MRKAVHPDGFCYRRLRRQLRGAKGVIASLRIEAAGSQVAQLVVYQRGQFIQSPAIAAPPFVEQSRDELGIVRHVLVSD